MRRTPATPLSGRLTAIRPATGADADTLVAWHADPDVARFWDGRTFTPDEMRARLQRSDVDPYIVMEGEEPVGYLQVWFEERVPGLAGLDMFLVPTARDRGLGPDAARALAVWLITAGIARVVTVDPYLSNGRAIAAWKKAGFVPVEERGADDDHTERWLSMEFERSRQRAEGAG